MNAAPHDGQPLRAAGASLDRASAAVIFVHGRGGSAEGILELRHELDHPHLAYLAPQAAGHTWYPHSFLAPMHSNEPGLSSGLAVLAGLMETLSREGIPSARTALIGFSQGACLLLEFVARNARRFGAVAGLSGGLIGPPGTVRAYDGSLAGTPVFLGCSDVDPHVPLERVHESAAVFERLDARVTARIYPSMGHTVNADEIEFVRSMIFEITDGEGNDD